MTFTTRPTLQGTFGMVASTHWLASQSGHGGARAGRQRLRRGGRRGLRAARGRAAPQRTRRRRAGDRGHGRRPARRASCAARGRRPPARPSSTTAALGFDLVPGLGAARGRRAGRGRRLADAAARPRHLGARRRPGAGDRVRPRRAPACCAGVGDDRRRGAASCSSDDWPTSADALAAPAAAAARGRAVPQPGVRRRRCSGSSTQAARRVSREAGHRRRPPGLVRRASSPRRSTRSRDRPFRDSSGEAHPGVITGAGPGRYSADLGGARHRSTSPATRSSRPGRGARGRCCCRRWPPWTRSAADALDPSTADGHPRPGRGAQARLRRPRGVVRRRRRGPARRPALPGVRRRARRADRRPTPRARSGRGRPAAARRGCPPRRRRRSPARRRRPAPTRPPASRPCGPTGDPRRHLPPRRGRPLGQHRLRDAQRRLAAELPGDPRARLPARQPAADVLARGGPAVLAGAGPPAADHAQPDAGAARRRAGAGLRHARRRPAGPVAAAVPAAHARRRADLQEAIDAPKWHTTSLPARSTRATCEPGRPGRRGPARRRRDRRAARPAGTTYGGAGPWTLGRLCAVARDPADRRALGRRRTRAACRATPAVGSPCDRVRLHHRAVGAAGRDDGGTIRPGRCRREARVVA